MPENLQASLDGRAFGPGPAKPLEWIMPTLLGLVAGLAAALFITVHWTVGVVAALVVLALSAAENEGFLLMMIFLVPVGWTLARDLPIRQVTVAARFATVGGFFLGRFWRGALDLRQLWRPRVTRYSFLVALVAVASIFFGTDGLTHDSVHAFYRLMSYIGFYLFLLAWIDSKQRLKKVASLLLASTIFISLYGMVQVITGGYTSLWLYLNPPGVAFESWSGRIPSLLQYSNSLAGYLNLVLPFALACWIFPSGEKFKRLGKVTFLLGSLTLIFTQSVGGLVAFGCFGLIAGFFLFKDSAKRTVWLGAVTILGIALYGARSILNPSHSSAHVVFYDLGNRLLLWEAAWHFFLHSPIWGIGWGNFAHAYGGYLNVPWIKSGIFMAHNIYLQLLSETGVVGFISFFSLIFVVLRDARRQMRSVSDPFDQSLAFGCFGALITVLVHGFVDYLFLVSAPFGTLFWMILALLVVSGRLRKRSWRPEAIKGRGTVAAGGA